jgi:hypothetical protein
LISRHDHRLHPAESPAQHGVRRLEHRLALPRRGEESVAEGTRDPRRGLSRSISAAHARWRGGRDNVALGAVLAFLLLRRYWQNGIAAGSVK